MIERSGSTAKLLVTDTSPLITLAAARSLDYLLYLDIPVIIPDGVLYEATVNAQALGASDIDTWVNSNPGKVNVAVTTVATAAFASGARIKGLGELAAIETAANYPLGPDERALLLFEDHRAVRQLAPNPTIVLIGTRDLLDLLEQAHRIQSADAVYDLARAAGREASQLSLIGGLTAEQRAAFERVMARARPVGEILSRTLGDGEKDTKS